MMNTNPISKETLRDAQKNPKDYLDLMVKVSGYSYRFVDLSRALQNDILARTEFSI
jgi:pyruvate-formate lyase